MRRWSFGGTQSFGVEQPRFAVAARHLPRNARRQVGDIERLYRADPQFASNQVVPDVIEADAERGHEPHPGDDDPPHEEAHPEPAANPATRTRRNGAPRRVPALCTFSYAPR